MFQLVDIRCVSGKLSQDCMTLQSQQSTAFKSGEFRSHKLGGMKAGVSAHCA